MKTNFKPGDLCKVIFVPTNDWLFEYFTYDNHMLHHHGELRKQDVFVYLGSSYRRGIDQEDTDGIEILFKGKVFIISNAILDHIMKI